MFRANLKTLIGGVVVASILGTVAWITFAPVPSQPPGQAARGEMRSLMRDLISREEAHWADNGTYSSVVEAIGLVVPEDVALQIELVESGGEQVGLRAVARSKIIDYGCRAGMRAPGAAEAMPLDSAVSASLFGFACAGEGF